MIEVERIDSIQREGTMALPEPSSKEEQDKKTTDQDDKDFHPSAEMMIHDIDDERTLEEEEALDNNSGTKVQEELDDLKKESEMPIEELLAYYERMRNEAQGDMESASEGGEEEEEEVDDEEDGEDEEEARSENHKRKDDKDDPDGEQSGKRHCPDPSDQQNKPREEQDTIQDQTSEPPQTSGTKQSDQTTSCSGYIDLGINSQEPASGTTTANVQGRSAESLSKTGDDAESSGVSDPTQKRHRPNMRDFLFDDSDGDVFTMLNGYDYDDSNDSSMDEDYSCSDDEDSDDEKDWRRIIHVGPEFQADVPEGLCEYDDVPPYENEDKLVWKCNQSLAQEQIIDYLKQASALSRRNDISISPASVPKISSESMRLYREKMQNITTISDQNTIENDHGNLASEYAHLDNLHDVYMSQSRKRMRIDYELEQENAIGGMGQSCVIAHNRFVNSKENSCELMSQGSRPEVSTQEYFHGEEQLLYLLLQCNYNFDEAMRRRKLDPLKYYILEPMSLWSQEECLGFENGLRNYGKNFRLIKEGKVQTRTHAEIVAFYYLWKKSERHDVYTNQYKLDRKRCLSHPGTTDYMDKFIEDNESSLMPNASTSTTPIPVRSEDLDAPPQKEYLVVKDTAHIQ